MADDFLATTATTGVLIADGQGSDGSIEANGDHDWFKVWLWGGHTYAITEEGRGNGGIGPLNDSEVRLFNSAGTFLIGNDDGGRGNNSYLRFVAPNSGYYYVDAGEHGNDDTGDYRVNAIQQADHLSSVNQWGSGVLDNARLGDFNADGRQDLIQITSNGTVQVLLATNTGFAPFATWTSGGTPSDQIGKIDANGSDDLLQIYNGAAFVAKSDGVSGFTPWQNFLSSGVQANAVLVHNNGDGLADLYQSNAGGTGFVALQNGGGTAFSSFTAVLTGTLLTDQVRDVTRDNNFNIIDRGTDFNGDGKTDVLQLYNGTAYVAVASGAGTTPGFVGASFQNWGNIGTTASDRAADVNGDGKADLVQIYNGDIYVALANAGGTAFNAFTKWGTSATPTDKLIDMNGDGRADLYQVFGGNAYVALANGVGTGFTAYDIWAHGVSGSELLGDVGINGINGGPTGGTGGGFGDGLPDVVQVYNGGAYVWQSQHVAGSDEHLFYF